MSNYPFWWDKTITIYNRITDSEGKVSWQFTTVNGCFWKYINNTTYVNKVRMDTKEIIVRIPKDEHYVPYETWKSLEDKENVFTLRNGDIIILGEVSDEIDEYTKGKRSTDLLAYYKDINRGAQIETFVEDIGNGLYAEHYRIAGI